MPRNILPISLFNVGWVTAPESEDIPANGFPLVQNLTGNADQGSLVGRYVDTLVSGTKPVYAASSFGWIIRDDGKRDLITFHPTDAAIKGVLDFYGTPASTVLASTGVGGVLASFNSLNRELHVGLGRGESFRPKWIGYISHGQFSDAIDSNIVVEDAECASASKVPLLDKAWSDGTNTYGISYGGDYLYKVVTTTITRTALGTFSNILAVGFDATPTWAWVIDRISEDDVILKRILLSDLSVVDTYGIAGITAPQGGAEITDCEVVYDGTDYHIFIALSADGTIGVSNKWLWRAALPALPGDITFTDVTPVAAGTSSGDWVDYHENYSGAGRTDEYIASTRVLVRKTYSRSLVKISEGASPAKIGWVWGPPEIPYSPYYDDVYYDYGGNEREIGDRYFGPYLKDTTNYRNPRLAMSVVYTNDASNQSRLIALNDSTTLEVSGVGYDQAGVGAYYSVGNTLYKHTVVLPTTDGQYSAYLTPTATKTMAGNHRAQNASSTYVYATTQGGTSKFYKYQIASSLAETSVYDGELFTITANQDTAGSGFTELRSYHWAIALEYDKVQVGPLSPVLESQENANGEQYGWDVTVAISDITKMSRRVSAILLFRASGEWRAVVGDTVPDSAFRLVDRLSLTDARWAVSSTAATLTLDDDVELTGETFDSYAGFSESLSNTIVHYGIACQANNQLFVGKCWHPDVETASHMIFRSQPYAYDTFDWSKDFLRLPIIPVAMVYFANRLWVFDTNRIFRVNPEGLYIEDTIDGIGTFSQRSVTVTEFGMFWADQNNLYMHDGTHITAIGETIKENATVLTTTLGYKYLLSVVYTSSNYNYPSVAYDGKSGYVLFCVRGTEQSASSYYTIYPYHPTLKHWMRWQVQTAVSPSVHHCLIPGRDGETYLSGGTQTWMVGGTTTNTQACVMYTPVLTLGAPRQKKRYYLLKASYTGTAPTLSYRCDRTGTFTTITSDRIYAYGKDIQFYVSLPADTKLYNLELIYRPLVGLR